MNTPTSKQIEFARSLAVRAGYSGYSPIDTARAAKSRRPANRLAPMSSRECSDLITWLKGKVTPAGRRGGSRSCPDCQLIEDAGDAMGCSRHRGNPQN